MVARSLACAITSALCAAAMPGVAAAVELDYSLYAGVEHTNNISLSDSDPESGNVVVPGVNFSLAQDGEDLQAHAVGTVEYRDYLGGTYDNQTLAELSGYANWSISPDRLDFIVQDFAGVQPLSTVSKDTPDNQQQTNVLSLGPNFYFRTGSLHGQAELRYIDSTASRTPEFDSSRGMGALRLTRNLSTASQLSGNAEFQHVSFHEDGSAPDYDRTEVFAHYASHHAHFASDIALGWSQIAFDHEGTAHSPLARLTLVWRPSPRSMFNVHAAREYSDAAEDMMVLPDDPTAELPTGSMGNPEGIDTGTAIIGSEAYLERRYSASYAFNSERLTLRISPLYRKLEYLNDTTFDRTGRGGSAGIDYRLRPRLTLSGFVNGEEFRYSSLSRRDKTWNYGLSLIGNETRHWSWRASFTRRTRNSSEPNENFSANEIYVGFVYQR